MRLAAALGERLTPVSQLAADGTQPSLVQEPPPKHRKPPTQRPGSFLLEVACIFATATVVSLLIKIFLVQAFFIPSGSMEPTLHGCTGCVGDRVLVNKLTSQMGGVHRGDIVVFRDPDGWLLNQHPSSTIVKQSRVYDALAFIGFLPSSSENDLIKRVIGVGGDTVEGRGGKVYVNSIPLEEPYVFPGNSPSEADFRVTVPAEKLWVMGDHRSESADSRFHQQEPGKGFVPVDNVVGRAFVIIWPFNRIGSLDRPATFDQPLVAPKR
jgi:signal peptidase I